MSNAEKFMIALLDVVGFKKMIKEKGVESLSNQYDSLLNEVSNSTKGTIYLGKSPIPTSVGSAIFSDTIIMWATNNEFGSLVNLLDACSYIFTRGLEIEMPVSGSIAFGDCVIDAMKSKILGQPIVDAYGLEQSQDWIGISIHDSIFDSILYQKKEYKEIVDSHIVAYNVPLKNDNSVSTSTKALCWPRRAFQHTNEQLEKEKLNAPENVKIRWQRAIDFLLYNRVGK